MFASGVKSHSCDDWLKAGGENGGMITPPSRPRSIYVRLSPSNEELPASSILLRLHLVLGPAHHRSHVPGEEEKK